MTSCLEFRAKTVETAIEKACHELGIPKKELDYDVMSHGATGIFGLVGVKKAKIRVTIAADGSRVRRADVHPNDQGPGEAGDGRATDVDSGGERQTASDDGAPDRPTVICREALERIAGLIDPEAGIRVEKKGDWIRADVRGGDSALLIGKHGQTLEAIQYLVEKVVNKAMGQRVRIQVDVEGYLANRRANLRRQAAKQAEKAQRSGKPASMGQMNAHDRRIVHMSLKDDRRVRTQSIGDGPTRKLLIIPKKSGSRRKRPRET
jgi:spoIIIJ-associated protein